jgi:hypothetical protein
MIAAISELISFSDFAAGGACSPCSDLLYVRGVRERAKHSESKSTVRLLVCVHVEDPPLQHLARRNAGHHKDESLQCAFEQPVCEEVGGKNT